MAGVHSEQIRKLNMSRIRDKNTKPEEVVRKYLFSHGFRYRKNDRRLPGKPDVVLSRFRAVVFVNGCFWHKHEGCKYFAWPKSNAEFWYEKIMGNVNRDRLNYSKLSNLGWKVFIVWECELRRDNFEDTMQQLIDRLKENADT